MEGDFRVGDWLVRPGLNRIEREGEKKSLVPKVMDVLVYLADHAGDVLHKERMIQAVWPDTFVTDDVLKHSIFELRKAFQDDAQNPRFIETIARRGYRLIAPVFEETQVAESRYQVGEAIGRGAMGEVFLAEDQLLKRKVALKFLLEELAEDQKARKRFIREARAAAALDHPFICSVHDTGELEGRTFIAMEYMEGQTLKDRMSEGALPSKEALKIASEVAEALEKAHNAGIVHRDLKPSNIMLTAEGHAKVMDFGLAKQLVPEGETVQDVSSTLTREWTVVGTLSYMSPEQVKGENVDHRSDIFSLGIILYNMMTGEHPFRKAAGAETISSILTEEPTPLTESRPDCPALLQHTVSKMLAKEVGGRHQSVREVRTDLSRLKEEFTSPKELVAAEGRTKSWLLGLAGPTVGIALLISVWLYFIAPTDPVPSGPPVVTPLTSMQGDENHPSLSPDGRQVAFVAGHFVGGNIKVSQVGVPEGVPIPLTNSGRDTAPVWSSDGNSIFFLRVLQAPWLEGMSEDRVVRLRVCSVPALGGQQRELAEISMIVLKLTGPPCLAAVADGKSLVVAGHPVSEEGSGLYMLSLETREMHRLTEPPDPEYFDYSPCFSPDGRTLAFMRTSREGGGDIYTLRFDERMKPIREPERLFSITAMFRGLAWQPDGKGLIYSAGPANNWKLWSVQTAEPESPEVLEFAGTGIRFPAASQENHRLVYQGRFADYNLYRQELDGSGVPVGQPQMFQSSSRSEYRAVYSPDGHKVAFASDRNGRNELFVCDRDGWNLILLVSQDLWPPQTKPTFEIEFWNPRWSPDGEWIAFTSHREGHTEIYVMRSEGGAPTRLASGAGTGWSADSKWVYFNSRRGGREAVWKVPVAGGEIVEAVWRELGRSADGEWLYFTDSLERGVWRQSFRGGEPIPVLEVTGALPQMVNNRIYAMTGDFQTQYFLQVYDLETGKAEEEMLDEGYFITDFSVAPDGRSILYSRNDQASSDIMLVENFH